MIQMRPKGQAMLSIATFEGLCEMHWGFRPSHPETAKLAADELRLRRIGSLSGSVRMQHYGATEREIARAPNLANFERKGTNSG